MGKSKQDLKTCTFSCFPGYLSKNLQNPSSPGENKKTAKFPGFQDFPGLVGALNIFTRQVKKNFMAPFYGWGSAASKLGLLQGGSLLFTTKFPEIHSTHFIDLRRMKG